MHPRSLQHELFAPSFPLHPKGRSPLPFLVAESLGRKIGRRPRIKKGPEMRLFARRRPKDAPEAKDAAGNPRGKKDKKGFLELGKKHAVYIRYNESTFFLQCVFPKKSIQVRLGVIPSIYALTRPCPTSQISSAHLIKGVKENRESHPPCPPISSGTARSWVHSAVFVFSPPSTLFCLARSRN